jgi:hypothetical protein
MKPGEASQHLSAFTILGKGHFQFVTSPMWLLGCPASPQRLMETVLRNIKIWLFTLMIYWCTQQCTKNTWWF